MTQPFDIGMIIGAAVVRPIVYLVLILGSAWLLDKVLKRYFRDYLLAIISMLPVGLIVLLRGAAGLNAWINGSADAFIKLETIVALACVLIAFAVRIKMADDEVSSSAPQLPQGSKQ